MQSAMSDTFGHGAFCFLSADLPFFNTKAFISEASQDIVRWGMLPAKGMWPSHMLLLCEGKGNTSILKIDQRKKEWYEIITSSS
jgi:hypothetical protein